MELLAPAGSMEAVTAAVQNGADAIYLGYGDFNARRNAKNFSSEEFAAAVSYCHLRGVKVYLTLNTLIADREFPAAAQQARQACDAGVDAILVQDLGILRMLGQVVPDVPIHASTQMTLHNLEGVRLAADLGMTRAVLSRELPRDQIAFICAHSPIEIEVFAHGALCMCYSGQCFLSSLIGTRSGNRGLCAQPCRLPYGWGDRADSYPLSLKDMSLAGHLEELREMGVACVKLEGRMKRPEYVAIVTSVYAKAIHEHREPTQEELSALAQAFSRQGFTDGYYQDSKGPHMFGVREDTREPKEVYARARATYDGPENPRVPITFYALIRAGEPAQVGVKDDGERVSTVEGPVPEAARTRPLTQEQVAGQLSKTGGTPFRCEGVRALVEDGLSLPLSALNSMRRQALDSLTALRTLPPVRRVGEFHPGFRYENRREPPRITMSVRRVDQISRELIALEPALLYIPLDELDVHPEYSAVSGATRIGVILPRVVWDREWPAFSEKLRQVRQLGVTDALVGNLSQVSLCRELGFTLRGDFGLEIYNTQALKQLRHMGFASATISFELRLAQIRDISKAVDVEMISYGRLPLMLMENCIIKNRNGRCGCQNENVLTDRKGARFPVVKAPGCRNELLNSKKLFLADKAGDYRKLGLWAQRLMFTTENARECVQVAQRYLERGNWSPNEYTRGLYYRDVE